MKKGFIIYTEYRQHLQGLSDEQLGKLLRAMFAHAEGGQPDELPPVAAMAFSFISAQMDRDMAKYQATCDRNRQNGKLGGRPRKDGSQPRAGADMETAHHNTEKQHAFPAPRAGIFFNRSRDNTATEAKVAAGELQLCDNTQYQAEQRHVDIPAGNVQISHKQREMFQRFWSAYPRKHRHGEAYNAFIALNVDEILLEKILHSLRQAQASPEWRREGGRYIPHASRWLAGRGWLDKYEDAAHGYSQRSYTESDLSALVDIL